MHYQWPSLPVVVMLGRQTWQLFTWTLLNRLDSDSHLYATCCYAYPCMWHIATFEGWIYIQGQRESPCHFKMLCLHLAFASFALQRMALWLGFSPNCRSYMSMDDFPSKTCHPWVSFHWGRETTWRVHWVGVQPWLTTPNFLVPWLIFCFIGHGVMPFLKWCRFSDWQVGWFRMLRNLMEFGSWRVTKGTEGIRRVRVALLLLTPQLTRCSNRFWAELMGIATIWSDSKTRNSLFKKIPGSIATTPQRFVRCGGYATKLSKLQLQ